jgi:anaerobic magnesium-protoporphyrin IX monomethyl ester cyclase
LHIVLVHPAGSNWIPGKKDVSTTANRMAPLGLLSIAAFLEKRGHSVEVEDCCGPYTATDPDETVRRILKHDPGLIGFSTTTSGFLDAYDLAGRLKSIHPEIQTVFGGVHVSAMGEELLKRFQHIDYLCLGEGEETMAELAAGIRPSDIHGLAFRDNGSVLINKPRELIPDLDSLPFPAYEKLRGFPSKYNLPLFSYVKPPGATMVTSRGCPYQCSYCDRSVFKRGYRYNSPSYIYEHMKHLRYQFGVRHINIYDDLFTLHRDRIESLCEMLIQTPLGIQFNCAVRVGHADDALLKILKAAGGLMVSIGIESGEPALLEVHKPGVYLNEVRDTVNRVHAAGLRVKGLFMMGLPGETPESIKKTSDFVMSLELDDMNMTKFTPFHGAPVWKNIFTEGQVQEDWRKMNCLNFVFLPKGIESWEVLDQLYNNHVKRFYSDPKWRKRFRNRIWEHRYSLLRLIRDLPDFLSAMRSFEPKKE